MNNTAPLARTTDPISSHIANSAIRNNKTLASLILTTVERLYMQSQEPCNDDQICFVIEARTERRQQRNVIARSRGLLERDGLLERVEDPSGRGRVVVIPNKQWREENGF